MIFSELLYCEFTVQSADERIFKINIPGMAKLQLRKMSISRDLCASKQIASMARKKQLLTSAT